MKKSNEINMVSYLSEPTPSEGRGAAPTVMYLIEVDPNVHPCLVGGSLPQQILDVDQNNTHYLIPLQGTDQIQIPDYIHCSGATSTSDVVLSNTSSSDHVPDNTKKATVAARRTYTNRSKAKDLHRPVETIPVTPAQDSTHITAKKTNSSCRQKSSEQALPAAPTELPAPVPSETQLPAHADTERPPFKYLHVCDAVPRPRALQTLPRALRRSGGGLAPCTTMPPQVRFGPVQGVVQDVSREKVRELVSKAAASSTPVFLLSKGDTVSHIDVSDQEKSNWFSLLPLGAPDSANVWLYQEAGELYCVSARSLAPRQVLRLGYSARYAAQHDLPSGQPVKDIHQEEEPLGWWCGECRQAFESAAALQRHKDFCHSDSPPSSRRRRYRCKHCALPFARLFTLKRHILLHCKSKTRITEPELVAAPPPPPPPPPADEDRLPSDESFHNFTSSLDFSTSLFDPDHMPLDISVTSRSELNLYGEKDDHFLTAQSEYDENMAFNGPSDLNAPLDYSKKSSKAATKTTCPYCEEIIPSSAKHRHKRQCVGRRLGCACGQRFGSRARLARHVLADHKHDHSNGAHVQTNSSDTYKCEQCENIFKRRGMLVNHLWRVHGTTARVPLERRERHYPCGACTKLYRSAAKRDRHERAHHPGAAVPRAACIESGRVRCAGAACPACPRQYATRAKLLQHMRAAHPLQAPPLRSDSLKKSKKLNKDIL